MTLSFTACALLLATTTVLWGVYTGMRKRLAPIDSASFAILYYSTQGICGILFWLFNGAPVLDPITGTAGLKLFYLFLGGFVIAFAEYLQLASTIHIRSSISNAAFSITYAISITSDYYINNTNISPEFLAIGCSLAFAGLAFVCYSGFLHEDRGGVGGGKLTSSSTGAADRRALQPFETTPLLGGGGGGGGGGGSEGSVTPKSTKSHQRTMFDIFTGDSSTPIEHSDDEEQDNDNDNDSVENGDLKSVHVNSDYFSTYSATSKSPNSDYTFWFFTLLGAGVLGSSWAVLFALSANGTDAITDPVLILVVFMSGQFFSVPFVVYVFEYMDVLGIADSDMDNWYDSITNIVQLPPLAVFWSIMIGVLVSIGYACYVYATYDGVFAPAVSIAFTMCIVPVATLASIFIFGEYQDVGFCSDILWLVYVGTLCYISAAYVFLYYAMND